MSVGTGDFKQFLYACRDGDLETVQYWVRRGAAINFLHAEFLFTPFHIALRNQHLDVVRYLLENGADPFLSEGYTADTPLSIAQDNNDQAAIALLQEYGVEVDNSVIGVIKRKVKKRLLDYLA